MYADIMQADELPQEGLPLLQRVLDRLKLIRLGESHTAWHAAGPLPMSTWGSALMHASGPEPNLMPVFA